MGKKSRVILNEISARIINAESEEVRAELQDLLSFVHAVDQDDEYELTELDLSKDFGK
jgi:hypothetical protein